MIALVASAGGHGALETVLQAHPAGLSRAAAGHAAPRGEPADAFAPIWGGTPIRVGWGLLFAVPLLIEFVRVSSGKDGGWLAGAYVNPADRRLVVPSTSGDGWRLNFARPAARVLAIVLAVLAGLVVLAVRGYLRAR